MSDYFWMDRNYRGLEEIGYLLSKEDIEKCFDFDESLSEAILKLQFGTVLEDAYWGNDTFQIFKVTEEEAVKLVQWLDFDPYSSHACVEMTEEYPDYIAEEYQLPVCMYNCTGYTDIHLPDGPVNGGSINHALIDFIKKHDIKESDLKYHYTPYDEIRAEISQEVHANEMTPEVFKELVSKLHYLIREDILASYDYEPIVVDIANMEKDTTIYNFGIQYPDDYIRYTFYESIDFGYGVFISKENILLEIRDGEDFYLKEYPKEDILKMHHSFIINEIEKDFPDIIDYPRIDREEEELER